MGARCTGSMAHWRLAQLAALASAFRYANSQDTSLPSSQNTSFPSFHVSPVAMDFFRGETYCMSVGSTLAAVYSAAERQAAREAIAAAGVLLAMTAATNSHSNGTWGWWGTGRLWSPGSFPWNTDEVGVLPDVISHSLALQLHCTGTIACRADGTVACRADGTVYTCRELQFWTLNTTLDNSSHVLCRREAKVSTPPPPPSWASPWVASYPSTSAPPAPPPPSLPFSPFPPFEVDAAADVARGVIKATFTLAGDASDIDATRRLAMRLLFAQRAAVDPDYVDLRFNGASVLVSVSIFVPEADAASTAELLATSVFANTSSLEAALASVGLADASVVEIESPPAVVTAAALGPVATALVVASIAFNIVVCALAAAYCYRRRHLAAATVAPHGVLPAAIGSGSKRQAGDRQRSHAPSSPTRRHSRRPEDFLRRRPCSFYFLRAEAVRRCNDAQLPSLNELRRSGRASEWVVVKSLSLREACCGAYSRHMLAVSHRWEEPHTPDGQGVQFAALRAHLQAHPEIELVWYDVSSPPPNPPASAPSASRARPAAATTAPKKRAAAVRLISLCAAQYACMPQKEWEVSANGSVTVHARTATEQKEFAQMLPNIPLLFLGASCLLLVDASYSSRFWARAAPPAYVTPLVACPPSISRRRSLTPSCRRSPPLCVPALTHLCCPRSPPLACADAVRGVAQPAVRHAGRAGGCGRGRAAVRGGLPAQRARPVRRAEDLRHLGAEDGSGGARDPFPSRRRSHQPQG